MKALELEQKLRDNVFVIGTKSDKTLNKLSVEVTEQESEISESDKADMHECIDGTDWKFIRFEVDGRDNTTYAYFEK